ncbi:MULTISPECIES: C40 family peptidase [unclassified Corynebacterium]|uniref:C40 family peptidase n=1 Tax=unclassified Corynebacterium TaxID=2624378 RepID=UPI001E379DBA|nr:MULTISPECIES: C40 family peptidase [unclassified Corynebacterium]
MGKHSLHARGARRSGRRGAMVIAVGALSSAAVAALQVPAGADNVDELIDRLEDVSHQATAKSEEIKALEDQVAESERKIAEADEKAAAARTAAAEANGAKASYQRNVNDIAQSKYRNSESEVLLTTLESGSPQVAIDRAAYLNSLSRNAQMTIDGLNTANEEAASRARSANIAKAEAEYNRNQLAAQLDALHRERDELDGQIRDIEDQVDSLNEEDRQRWIAKDGPIDLGANVPAADSGVVAAALAQIGKPYGWGATGPDAFDCSGLMVWAYGQNGKGIPRTSQAQLAGGTPVSMDQLQPGDIIGYYPGVTHVAMYIGDGMVVHASDYGIPVQVVPVNSMPAQGAVRY